jgi:hypothetical protein
MVVRGGKTAHTTADIASVVTNHSILTLKFSIARTTVILNPLRTVNSVKAKLNPR